MPARRHGCRNVNGALRTIDLTGLTGPEPCPVARFRFEAVDKRFEDMNKRFTSLQWMGTVAFVVLGIVISVVGLQ